MSDRLVLTPEHVEIRLQPAGLGSRFLAVTIDFLAMMAISGMLATVMSLLPAALGEPLWATSTFLVLWGYHVYFEAAHEGRSPGKRALRLRDHWLDHPPSPHGRVVHAGIIAAQMDRFLAWKPTDNDNRKLVKHLRNERDALFTFLRNPAVPASNWWGEQAIRPAVVTRKIWGGNRTPHGAITQGRVATFFRTSHQQDADPYTLLEVALRSPVSIVAGLPSLIAGP